MSKDNRNFDVSADGSCGEAPYRYLNYRRLAIAVLEQAVSDIKLLGDNPMIAAELEDFLISGDFDTWWDTAEIGGNCNKAKKELLVLLRKKRNNR